MPRLSRLVSCLLLPLYLALAGAASATNFNTSDVLAHGAWLSLALSLSKERHFRAMEGTSYSDAILSLAGADAAIERMQRQCQLASP
jgi:hypothetical protein